MAHKLKIELWACIWILAMSTGYGFQSTSSSSDERFFDDSFYDEFEEMDREDRIHEQLDRGFDNWEQQCKEMGGESLLKKWNSAQENLVYCFLQNFPPEQIYGEIEYKKKTGDLDQVFKHYCGTPVSHFRPCIRNFLETSRLCLSQQDRGGINVTMRMIDAAIDFVCHNRGDRLALFMSEKGWECVQDHSEAILSCINQTVPEIFEKNKKRNIELLIFYYQDCRSGSAIRRCVERELLKCPDPTPSNVVNSMLLAMTNATPCKRTSRFAPPGPGQVSRASGSWPSLGLWSSLLTFSLMHLLEQ